MAGHSQFKNIMYRKGAQDKKRSKMFSKLAREITAAAKIGIPEIAMNPRLRSAVLAARAQNMPKDNIERAIKKSQEAGGADYVEVRYEGFAPGGVGVIVEALTDNRNRTAGEVRSIFTKYGGNLGETGAVSFGFSALARSSIRSRPAAPRRCLRRPSRRAPTIARPIRTRIGLRPASRPITRLRRLLRPSSARRSRPPSCGGRRIPSMSTRRRARSS